MEAITSRQLEVLRFIHTFINDNGYPPTSADIGERFGMYASGAAQHIDTLLEKGFINKVPRISRSITITQDGLMKILKPKKRTPIK